MDNVDMVLTDVLIVGGGPSGLATAIHLADKLKEKGEEKRVMLIEKGSVIIGRWTIDSSQIQWDENKIDITIPDMAPGEYDISVLVGTREATTKFEVVKP